MEKLKLYGIKIEETDEKSLKEKVLNLKELTPSEKLFMKEFYSWRKEVREEFLKKKKGLIEKLGMRRLRKILRRIEEVKPEFKDEKKEEFLGEIYVNEKKEIVVEVKDPQVRETIFQEINKEFQKQSGILLWPKFKGEELYSENENQEFRKKIKLLSETDKAFKRYLEELGNLWRERIRLSIEKEKLLNKRDLKKKEVEEIEEVEKRIKEIEEKIKKKEGEEDEKFWDVEWECYKSRILAHTLFMAFSTLGLGIEKPGSPLFLAALRRHLVSSGKKYGSYVLSKQLPIVEED